MSHMSLDVDIPSLRGELPLLSSFSSFCDDDAALDCREASFAAGTDDSVDCVSCLELEFVTCSEFNTIFEESKMYRSIRRAYSSILIRRMRSSFTFSKERLSPSRRAMRA